MGATFAETHHLKRAGVLMRLNICFVIVLLCLVGMASADIYKCVSEDGVVKFSDEPCSRKAEVAFETEDLNFDEAIGNASPYPKLPVPESEFDTEDMVTFAKKIGRHIITGEHNNSARLERYRNRQYWTNKVYLNFGPPSDDWRYRVIMHYEVKKRFEGTFVWLDSIEVTKHGKPYDPPSMDPVKTFKKMSVGKWKIRHKGSNWP
jgi:hypothetical protein